MTLLSGIVREFPLDTLLDHVDGLVDEVGELFNWVWPFFSASMTGEWPTLANSDSVESREDASDDIIDEDAPATIQELSEYSSIPNEFLRQMEDALLTKQQVVLVGPPGTSKTYIAGIFGRYFVRQREGQPQGRSDTLYMHANWSYEDFFEGLKPTVADGQLSFQPKKGHFLEWVASLREYDSASRHVLILDEINRCDTAAVLGELLQLLEYRGRRVTLLSGSKLVFPRNLYIIGTMNSADRSIGRMDLALRRRFLWLELLPRPDVLERWLARKGNNPVGFKAASLQQCNQILEEIGIPPEQQIGHALFMVQTQGDETSEPKDHPLRRELLERIVRFSIVPYLKELFLMQFGRTESAKVAQIENLLLAVGQEEASE